MCDVINEPVIKRRDHEQVVSIFPGSLRNWSKVRPEHLESISTTRFVDERTKKLGSFTNKETLFLDTKRSSFLELPVSLKKVDKIKPGSRRRSVRRWCRRWRSRRRCPTSCSASWRHAKWTSRRWIERRWRSNRLSWSSGEWVAETKEIAITSQPQQTYFFYLFCWAVFTNLFRP